MLDDISVSHKFKYLERSQKLEDESKMSYLRDSELISIPLQITTMVTSYITSALNSLGTLPKDEGTDNINKHGRMLEFFMYICIHAQAKVRDTETD